MLPHFFDHYHITIGLGEGLMIDAKFMGSLARFANHSCYPSCKLQKWRVKGDVHVVLVALKDLNEGSEVILKSYDDYSLSIIITIILIIIIIIIFYYLISILFLFITIF
jgi:hypothetical protein